MGLGAPLARAKGAVPTNILIHKSLRWLSILAQALAVALLVLWIADWAVFRVRSAHGNAYLTLEVQDYLTTPLKGSKDEYDYLGSEPVTCTRAIFPHAAVEPCWWLRRHTVQWE